MALSTLKVRARVYVVGDSYAIKDRLKALGCHWDGERRQWWIGAAKANTLYAMLAASVVGEVAPSAAAVEAAGGSPEAVQAAADGEAAWDGPQGRKPEDPKSIRLTGKGEYKGRSYYVGASTRDGKRCRLLTLPDADGKYLDFWADSSQVRITKRYEARERSYGYGRYRQTEYTTLGSIASFVRRQSNPETRRGRCTECDAWGPVGEPCSECGGEGSYV